MGDYLKPEVKLISLKLVQLPESTVLASLNLYTENCMTYGDYASCIINTSYVHKSKLRVLVHDLEEGESREFGCVANTVNAQGDPVLEDWKTVVARISKEKVY